MAWPSTDAVWDTIVAGSGDFGRGDGLGLECGRGDGVAHAAMAEAGWTGDPAEVAAAAEELAEKLMRDGATD